MVEKGKLKIVIPKNMGTTRVHLALAGWSPVFDHGFPTDVDPMGSGLDKGIIESTGDEIMRIRSRDIPRTISWNYADVGFVGSDCVVGRSNKQIAILSSFTYGREWGGRQSRVEIVAHSDSAVSSVEQIKPGSIFLAEPQHFHLTKKFLEDHGYKVLLEGYSAGPEFHKRLIENGCVGISQVGGSVPVLLDPELHFGIMVNESGRTVRDYTLKVVARVCDIETLLIANVKALGDETKGERINQLREDLESVYRIQGEFEINGGPERERI